MAEWRLSIRIFALAGVALAAGCVASERPPENPGIVLVVIDTLRADHLHAYGYNRPTSPHLDRLSDEGERYEQAYSQSPWTLPAIATMLTGRLPQIHGAGLDPDGRLFPLRAGVPTLAETLSQAGFRTGAIVNVEFCRPRSGLARGFGTYDFVAGTDSNRGGRDAAGTTDAALKWLSGIGDEPFFLLVHYFDPHLTYDPPAPYDTMFQGGEASLIGRGFGTVEQLFALRRGEVTLSPAQRKSLIARYDGEIRFVDEQFGRLREGLEQAGLWDRSLVFVTSDHGEEFWEHGGFEHGHSHHREVLRIPLIARWPDGRTGIRHGRVRQLDLAPTILSYVGLPIPPELPGRPLDEQGSSYSVAAGSLWAGYLLSIRSDDGTLILDRAGGRRLFFPPEDQAEKREARASHLRTANRLEDILRTLPDPLQDVAQELTDEQRENLRTLGYIQ